MINIDKIISSSIDENLTMFIKETQANSSSDSFENQIKCNKALMNFSKLLLKKYHEALKEELSKQGINI